MSARSSASIQQLAGHLELFNACQNAEEAEREGTTVIASSSPYVLSIHQTRPEEENAFGNLRIKYQAHIHVAL